QFDDVGPGHLDPESPDRPTDDDQALAIQRQVERPTEAAVANADHVEMVAQAALPERCRVVDWRRGRYRIGRRRCRPRCVGAAGVAPWARPNSPRSAPRRRW